MTETTSRFAFGEFLLDTEARALLRGGEPIPITGRTLDTLVVLVQNRGRLIDKDELLSLIWPGIIVDEANLSQSIFTLRKLLGDSPKSRRYIATIAGRGYQFVAPVTEIQAERPLPPAPIASSSSTTNWVGSYARLSIAAAALIGVAVAVVFWVSHERPARAPAELVEHRLTFNSSANEVTGAAISPDGKYLAYSDPAGIHIRLLSTGEERVIPLANVGSVSAYSAVDAWFPNGTELLGHSQEAGGRNSVWAISVMGQSLRELRAGAVGWAISPDGTHIAFSPADGGGPRPEVWVMDNHGEHARKILGSRPGEHLWSVRWSPNGQRLAYIRAQPPEEWLETCDLNGGNRTTVVKTATLGQWVRSLWWLPDGRIVYSRAEGADVEANLWQVPVKVSDGKPAGLSKRVTHWGGVDVQGLSASADGTRLVLRKESFPSQIYIGEVAADAKPLHQPQRLTNDEASNWATGWTADSKAVVFTSDRGGKWGVFKQQIGADSPQPLIQGRDNANLVRMSPDGAWVLYSETVWTQADRSRSYRLIRLPINGGAPSVVYESTKATLSDYPCARSPASRCVVIEESPDRKRLTIAALDPLIGKGALLKTLDKDPRAGFSWALSPEGSVLALAKGDELETRIRLVSLEGGPDREIAVKDWPNIESMDWSPDGKGIYCGSMTSQRGTLLYVDLKGTTQVVLRSDEIGGGSFIAAAPSPNGRHLALTGAIHYSNAWLLEGF